MSTDDPGGVDVWLAQGIWTSDGAAAYVVDFFELGRKLLARFGYPMPSEAEALQRNYRECLKLRAGCATATPQPAFGPDALASISELIALPAAAVEAGVTGSALRKACGRGYLGRKVGNRWLISREELELYKTSRGVLNASQG